MNGIRKLIGFLMVMVFAAITVPAMADGGDQYKLVVSQTSAAPGPQTITVVVTNKAPFDFFKKIVITAPTNAHITAKPTAALGTSDITSKITSWDAGQVTVSGIAYAYGKAVTLMIPVMFDTNCGSQTTSWGSTITGGLLVSNEVFNPSADTSRTTTITYAGVFSMQIDPNGTATSVAPGTPFNVTVKQTSSCPTTIFPAVVLTADKTVFTAGSATITANPPNANTTVFTGNIFAPPGVPPAVPPTSLIVYAKAGAPYPDQSTTLPVFAQTVAQCSADPIHPITGSTFNVSCGLGTTGFAVGVRGPDKGNGCAPNVNFTLTNNICDLVNSATDANGKTIPAKAISFVWDQNYKSAFTYTVTWNPERVGANGLPVPGLTKYCHAGTSTPCDITDPLQACTGTDVAFGSIPTGQPACIVEEDWTVVPQSSCSLLMGTGACIQVTTTIIDAIDPPIIRN